MLYNVTFDESLRNSFRRENVPIFLRAYVFHQNVSFCLNDDNYHHNQSLSDFSIELSSQIIIKFVGQ